MDIESEARALIADKLGADLDKLTDDLDLVKDLGADSLDIVELELAFEDELDIYLEDDETENIRTVGELIAYLKMKQETTKGTAQ